MSQHASSIPYAFAKANGVVVTALGDDDAEVVMRNDARASALAEVRRALVGVPVKVRRMVREQFDELIAATYNSPGVGAAALADDLAQDLDLSQLLQEIPKVEDLLDSQDDAPITRLINALLTQALREGASDIHIEPFETRSLKATAAKAAVPVAGLQRIGEVPTYHADAIVRRAPALQKTAAAAALQGAWMTGATLASVGVAEDEDVIVCQGAGSIVLKAKRDDRLPAGCVRVAGLTRDRCRIRRRTSARRWRRGGIPPWRRCARIPTR